MIEVVCSTCARRIWGNYGDGLWRHYSLLGYPIMSAMCNGQPIQPKEKT